MGAATDPAVVITDAMLAVDHELHHLPPSSALQLIEFCRRRLAANEARILASRYEAGAYDRDVEKMAAGNDGKTSKAEAKKTCLLYTSPSPRDQRGSRMPSSA